MDPVDPGIERTRHIGSYRGEAAGPTLVCVGGLHGDEPSGVLALERVFQALERRRPAIRGELVGIAGNLSALAQNRRYLTRDLNRYWRDESIERVGAAEPANLIDEDRELGELLDALHEVFARARGEIYFLDLHTSSADGEPFVCIGDTLRNREYAEQFCVPVILGLEECIDGVLLEYVNNLGHITVGVEAGQHRKETSVDRLEAFLWLALLNAGIVDAEDVPGLDDFRERLRRSSHHLHGFMEVRQRHPVGPEDDFEMEPGFRNFQRVAAGDLLAHDHTGEIHAYENGRVLLPLYQGLGSDGFFIAREVGVFWLKVSVLLRRLGLDSILHWLPGVSRHPEREATLIVDTAVARWLAIEVFHLLGYRKLRSEDGRLLVSRRQFDHRSPRAA